jgi:hypothetical protein
MGITFINNFKNDEIGRLFENSSNEMLILYNNIWSHSDNQPFHFSCLSSNSLKEKRLFLLDTLTNLLINPWLQSAKEPYRPSDRRLSANLVPTLADRGVSRGQGDGSLPQYSRSSRPQPLLYLPSSSSIVLMRLNGPRSRTTTFQKIW